jgi:uncharacterized HhH-GPD family protein
MVLVLPIDSAANELVRRDPLALLIAMLLDQQVPMEWAFAAPHRLAERLGVDRLDAQTIARYDPDALVEIFSMPPALHRFPGAMAARVQKLCQVIVDDFGGDPASVWTKAKTGAELFKRLKTLPGFGAQKAQIFAALLGKQFGVRPQGWREAAGSYGAEGVHHSVADVTDEASLAKVRDHKKQMKAAAKVADK